MRGAAKRLPVISESTEKLCTLKLKQFGLANKRNELPIMKSCIVEAFDEDFASAKNNQVYSRVIPSQQPLSANNKKIADNSQSTFSLLNYFMKNKQK